MYFTKFTNLKLAIGKYDISSPFRWVFDPPNLSVSLPNILQLSSFYQRFSNAGSAKTPPESQRVGSAMSVGSDSAWEQLRDKDTREGTLDDCGCRDLS